MCFAVTRPIASHKEASLGAGWLGLRRDQAGCWAGWCTIWPWQREATLGCVPFALLTFFRFGAWQALMRIGTLTCWSWRLKDLSETTWETPRSVWENWGWKFFMERFQQEMRLPFSWEAQLEQIQCSILNALVLSPIAWPCFGQPQVKQFEKP